MFYCAEFVTVGVIFVFSFAVPIYYHRLYFMKVCVYYCQYGGLLVFLHQEVFSQVHGSIWKAILPFY